MLQYVRMCNTEDTFFVFKISYITSCQEGTNMSIMAQFIRESISRKHIEQA